MPVSATAAVSDTDSALLDEVGRALRQPSIEALDAIHARLDAAHAPAAALHALRGEALRRQGKAREAATLLDDAIAALPSLLPAYHCAALAHVAAGNAARARAIWLALLERHVDDPIARYQIALTFHDAGDLGAAMDWYGQQVRRHPQTLPAWYNLGLVALARGDTERAIDALSTVTAGDAQHRRAWIALGKARRAHGDERGAIEAWLAADRLPPRDTEPLRLAAAALVDQLELPGALALLERALALDARDPALYWARGSHLSNLGLHVEAAQAFRTALSLDPADWRGESRLLLELHYDEALASPEDLAAAHRAWAARHIPAAIAPRSRSVRRTRERLRIGYLSPRFGAGPLATLFLPVLQAHDRRKVHVTLYSAWPHGDAIAARMQSAADAWRELPADDDAAAAAIAADGLDILIDLAGHAPGHRLHVLARKPAPVQACWLDYFDTSGLDAVDYLISDALHTPPSDAVHFRERLVLLPGCRFVYAPVVPPSSAPAPSSANGYVTFGSFNRHAKITERMLHAWQAILERVPESRLELRSSVYGGAGTVRWLRERWRAAGIAVERIDFRPYVPVEQAMRAYSGIDIALDTAPYNGGVTTCDALVSGVPVITQSGARMIARQSAALLHAAGHPEWIGRSLSEYVELAVVLATPATLAAVRQRLSAEMPGSALCDVPRFVARFEHTLRELVALGPRHGAGGAPLAIAA